MRINTTYDVGGRDVRAGAHWPVSVDSRLRVTVVCDAVDPIEFSAVVEYGSHELHRTERFGAVNGDATAGHGRAQKAGLQWLDDRIVNLLRG